VNVGKAKNELGWAPEMPLEEGLRRTFDFFAAKARGAQS
jgi:nucleoside-diphosphate-sugar epimerase